MIDLRSDTVSKPSEEMLKAMMSAEVGDDVYGEDPTVNRLEKTLADMFGFDGGLFCPTGTMTNQIAIKLHTDIGDEVICHSHSHIYNYEGGAIAATNLCQAKLLGDEENPRGIISPVKLEEAINPDDAHLPRTALVSLENTCNRGGGSCYSLEQFLEIKKVVDRHQIALHLDGARLFNAMVKMQYDYHELGNIFDTISICFSKGLGCPVGSVLLLRKSNVHLARRIRKRLGGGMRQAGYLAAAGLYSLEHNIDRLQEDHDNASELSKVLQGHPQVDRVEEVETNIVIFTIKDKTKTNQLIQFLKSNGILFSMIKPGKFRMVTHLNISQEQTQKVCEAIKKWN